MIWSSRLLDEIENIINRAPHSEMRLRVDLDFSAILQRIELGGK